MSLTDFSFRLPEVIVPVRYEILISPKYPNFCEIFGSCIIELKVLKKTNKIFLHSENLNIYSAELNSKLCKIVYSNKYRQIMLEFMEDIDDGSILHMKYTGKVSEGLLGLIKVDSDNLLYTQFQPTGARKVFPCFDEPCFKAKFKISVEIDLRSDMIVYSNSDTQKITKNSSSVTYFFAETDKIPSYSVAIYIGRGERVVNLGRPVLGIIDNDITSVDLDLTFNIARSCIEFCEKYLEIEFPYPKVDILETSNFSSGAMENVGLIIGRTDSLLFKKKLLTSKHHLVHTASTLCHEIIHQWLGNLVTMKWWQDTWFNESFTTWMSGKVLYEILPDMRCYLGDNLLLNTHVPILMKDICGTARSVISYPNSDDDIISVFDDITYEKGYMVVGLIEKSISPETMRRSLSQFLKKYIANNVTTVDLMTHFDKFYPGISLIIKDWVYSSEYPLLSCERNEGKIVIVQENNKKTMKLGTRFFKSESIEYSELPKEIFDPFLFCVVNFDDCTFDGIIRDIKYFHDREIAKLLNDLFVLLLKMEIGFRKYIERAQKILVSSLGVHKKLSVTISVLSIQRKMFFSLVVSEKALAVFRTFIENVLGCLRFDYHQDTIGDKSGIIFDLLFFVKSRVIESFCGEIWKNIILKRQYNKYRKCVQHVLAFVIEKDNGEKFDLLYEEIRNNKCPFHVVESISLTRITDKYDTMINFMMGNETKHQDRDYILECLSKNKFFAKRLWNFIRNNWENVVRNLEKSQFGILSMAQSLENICDSKNMYDEIENVLSRCKKFKKNSRNILARMKHKISFGEALTLELI